MPSSEALQSVSYIHLAHTAVAYFLLFSQQNNCKDFTLLCFLFITFHLRYCAFPSCCFHNEQQSKLHAAACSPSLITIALLLCLTCISDANNKNYIHMRCYASTFSLNRQPQSLHYNPYLHRCAIFLFWALLCCCVYSALCLQN